MAYITWHDTFHIDHCYLTSSSQNSRCVTNTPHHPSASRELDHEPRPPTTYIYNRFPPHIHNKKNQPQLPVSIPQTMAPPPPQPPPPQQSGPLTLLGPLLLIYYSATYIPSTILSLLKASDFKPLTNVSLFKEIWFARFWTWFGSRAAENAAPKVTPLIQNNASGTVLDIGPGSGQWLFLYARALNPSITKIYGVEPNVGLHAELRRKVVEAGLEGVYEVIGCGAEELGSKGGVQRGSVDTIVTVQCLCSIPGPERVIGDLYPLLRGGGKWIVYEHVRTKYQGDFVGGWQREFLFFFFSLFFVCLNVLMKTC